MKPWKSYYNTHLLMKLSFKSNVIIIFDSYRFYGLVECFSREDRHSSSIVLLSISESKAKIDSSMLINSWIIYYPKLVKTVYRVIFA
jgi:hypothetical protein